ncbi:MAG: hypothetical protein ABEJ72_06840 [Candidatus Aenigmatarchaeota archaeon]
MVFDSWKGNMSINTVMIIVLGLLIVAFLYAGYSNWFSDIGSGFVGSVEFPKG